MEAANGTTTSPPPLLSSSRQPPREDCWSEDATFTLIEAWGDRYLELNRGNLRQKHWQEVADTVNDRHFNGASAAKAQPYRTDTQCKNRIDTLKKKYKIERARVSESNGSYTSPWPFFAVLDDLLRPNLPTTEMSESAAEFQRFTPSPMAITPFPVAPRSAIPRRPATNPAPVSLPFLSNESSYGFRGNLSAFAAAAAAAASPASEDDSEGSRSRSSGRKRGREGEEEEEEAAAAGYRQVAEAIERLGKIYERVEERKRREMVELEKQRMRFAKELECHRMQLFTEMQVRLHKIKRGKGSSSSVAANATAAVMQWVSDSW